MKRYRRKYAQSPKGIATRQRYVRSAKGKANWTRGSARRRGVRHARLTAEEWERLVGAFNGCAYCDAPATEQDHIVPLAKGGQHVWGNIAPACRSCNRSKSTRPIDEWLAAKQIDAADFWARLAAA